MLRDLNIKPISKFFQKNKDDFLCFQSNITTTQMVFPISQPELLRKGFLFEIINKGYNLYEMVIQDLSHYLGCTLYMKVEDYNDEKGMTGKVVVCYFPQIDDEPLKKIVGSTMCYDMLTVQFQMRILKLLLLFSINHHTLQLVIHTDGRQAEKFSIYANFLSHYGKIFNVDRHKSEILIPINSEAFNKWISFMDRANQALCFGLCEGDQFDLFVE